MFMKISVVIPVYNEAALVDLVIKSVAEQHLPGWKKELIIVDDGSTDQTVPVIRKILKSLSSEDLSSTLLVQQKNQGKGAALKRGVQKSHGDCVIVQDADLEYSPRDYERLLDPFLRFRADAVYGSRFATDQPRRVLYYWHYQANKILTSFSNICTGLNVTDMETGYKVFRGDLIRTLAPSLKSTRFGFEPEITARIARIPNLRLFEVGISYQGRTYAEGKKIGWRDGILAFWEIVRFNFLER